MSIQLTNIEYQSLPAEDEETPVPSNLTSRSNDRSLSIPIILLVVACTIANLALFISDQPRTAFISRDSVTTLPRPNQFMGLDKIERAAPPISRQFVNYPFLLTQIDSGRPSYVYSDDPKRHMTFRGYISPEDRQVSVSAQISTIVQFRALDFGMEDCELSMVVPITREGSNFTLANDESAHTIDIWRLSANTAIDAKRLSYSTRPPRSSKVASADVIMGSSFNHHFHCPQDSVHSFELACAPESPSCHVEWWQNVEGAFPAIYLTQYATV